MKIKKIIEAILIISLLINSAGQGYALRPIAERVSRRMRAARELYEAPKDGRWVKWAELAAYVLASGKIKDLEDAIRTGSNIQDVLDGCPGKATYMEGLIEELAKFSFEDRARAIVEVTANAVNAVSTCDEPRSKNVEVNIGPYGFEIEEDGVGMGLGRILRRYFTPVLSGWKKDKRTSGRFGHGGSLSSTAYLEEPADLLNAVTSDGKEGWDIECRRFKDGLYVNIERTDQVRRGTKVVLKSNSFSEGNAEKLLKERMSVNLDASIFVSNSKGRRLLNDLSGYVPPVGDDDIGRFTYLGDFDQQSCNVALSVCGETILRMDVKGMNLPQAVIMNLPKSASMPVQKGALKFNEKTVETFYGMIDLALRQRSGIELLSTVYPVLERVQKENATEDRQKGSMLVYAQEAIVEARKEEWLYLANDNPALADVSVEGKQIRFIAPGLANEKAVRPCWEPYRYRRGRGNKLCIAVKIADPNRYFISSKTMLFWQKDLLPDTPLKCALSDKLMHEEREFGFEFSPQIQATSAQVAKAGELSVEESSQIERCYEELASRYPKGAPGAKPFMDFFLQLFDEKDDPALRREFIDEFFALLEDDRMSGKNFWQDTIASVVTDGDFIRERFMILRPLVRILIMGEGTDSPAMLDRVGFKRLCKNIFYIDEITAKDRAAGNNLCGELKPKIIEILGKQGNIDNNQWCEFLRSFTWFSEGGKEDVVKELFGNIELTRQFVDLIGKGLMAKDKRGSFLIHGSYHTYLPKLTLLGGDLPSAIRLFAEYAKDDPGRCFTGFRDFVTFIYLLTDKNTNPLHAERLLSEKAFGKRVLAAWSDKRLGLLHMEEESYEKTAAPIRESLLASGITHQGLTKRGMRSYFDYACRKGGVSDEIPQGPAFIKSLKGAETKEIIEFTLSQLLCDFLSGDQEAADTEGELARLRELNNRRFPGEAVEFSQGAIPQAASILSGLRPYLWLRDAFQNYMDEVRRTGAKGDLRKANISSFKEEGQDALVTRISSGLSIDLQTILNLLLIPWASSKRGKKGPIGQHGVGFFSMFAKNGQVNIYARLEENLGICLSLNPVPNVASGEMEDAECKLYVLEGDLPAGTSFETVDNYLPSVLEPEFVSSYARLYGGLVPRELLEITCQDELINRERKELWRVNSSLGTLICLACTGEGGVVQEGLYVQPVTEGFYPYLYKDVLGCLRGHEFDELALEISPDMDLIADRSKLINENILLEQRGLGLDIETVTAGAALQLFLHGHGLPLTSSLTSLRGKEKDILGDKKAGQDVRLDAVLLSQQKRVDLQKYSRDRWKYGYLGPYCVGAIVCLAPIAETKEGPMSIYEIFTHFVESRIKNQNLPDRVKEALGNLPPCAVKSFEIARKELLKFHDLAENIRSVRAERRPSTATEEKAERPKADEPPPLSPCLLPEKVEPGFNTYWAFAEMCERSASCIFKALGGERTVSLGFHNLRDHAGGSFVTTEPPGIWKRTTRLGENEAPSLKDLSLILQGKASPEQEKEYLGRFFSNNIFSWVAAISTGSGTFYGEEMRKKEKEIAWVAMELLEELDKIYADVKEKYSGTLIPQQQFEDYVRESGIDSDAARSSSAGAEALLVSDRISTVQAQHKAIKTAA